jgi:hypothetical protein
MSAFTSPGKLSCTHSRKAKKIMHLEGPLFFETKYTSANFKTSRFDRSPDWRSALGLVPLWTRERFENGSIDLFVQTTLLLLEELNDACIIAFGTLEFYDAAETFAVLG